MSEMVHGKNYHDAHLLLGAALFLLSLASGCGSNTRSASNEAFPLIKKQGKNESSSERPRGFSNPRLIGQQHWLVEDAVGLWRTLDSGSTWELSYRFANPGTAVDKSLRGVSFVDAQTGFLIDREMLYRTRDGGASWDLVGVVGLENEEYFFNKLCFVDSLHGWAVGLVWRRDFLANPVAPQHEGVVLATRDGGITWHRQRLDLPHRYFELGMRWSVQDVFFRSSKTGWLVGDQIILWTVDGGETWRFTDCCGQRKYIRDYQRVFFVDAQNGCVTMRNSSDFLVTSDGGRLWRMVRGPENVVSHPLRLVFLTPKHWFAILARVHETRDGGKTWQRRSIGTCDEIQGGVFIGQALNHALVALCFESGKLTDGATSVDNGRTWSSNSPKQ